MNTVMQQNNYYYGPQPSNDSGMQFVVGFIVFIIIIFLIIGIVAVARN